MSKKTKNLVFYFGMIILFGSLMYLIAKEGEHRETSNAIYAAHDSPKNLSEGFDVFRGLVLEHIQSSLGILLLQIIIILLVCRIFGWLFQKIGQPTVIGEIVAGIVLGPSVLGHWFPGISETIFPVASLANINILSQFGLILFMFAIGMELDVGEVRKKLNETILISHTSTVVPFFFGMVTAFFLYGKYADKSTPFLSFALFISIALSITAFPVLARIIQEKGLTKSHLGTIALASAANGDITAWCLLAVVVAIAQAGTMLSAVYNIFFSVVYILLMFSAVRPFLRMVGNIYHNKEVIDKGLVAFMFLLLVVSSYLTEILGLHALFGAFISGVVMPGNIKFRKIMTEKVEDVSLSLFLPLFFASTGLRTEIGLLNSPELWTMCVIITLVAIAGKFGGAMVSARFVGESWKNSLYIGALMNTRGLMELVVLTIGYEMGILTPPIFVMLVLMTLVTTFMTTPLISFISYCFPKGKAHKAPILQQQPAGIFKLLLSFGRAGNGQIMLDVAHQMFSQTNKKLEITALHLTIGHDVNPMHTDNFEEVSFGPIIYGAKKLNIPIETRYEVSSNAGQDICDIANKEGYDFLLVGAGISLSDVPTDMDASRIKDLFYNRFLRRLRAPESWFYPGELLKDKTKYFIEHTNCPVGVFINRQFVRATYTLVVINCANDLFLLNYARTLQRSTNTGLTVLNRLNEEHEDYQQVVKELYVFTELQQHGVISRENDLNQSMLRAFNFMLVSYNTWNIISQDSKKALQRMPSALILSK